MTQQTDCPVCKTELQETYQVELIKKFNCITNEPTSGNWNVIVASCRKCGVMFLLN